MEVNVSHDRKEVNIKSFKKLIPVKHFREWSSKMKSDDTWYWHGNLKLLAGVIITV
jgi:hypothetical protein